MKSTKNEEEFNFGRERKWNNKEQLFLDGKKNWMNFIYLIFGWKVRINVLFKGLDGNSKMNAILYSFYGYRQEK